MTESKYVSKDVADAVQLVPYEFREDECRKLRKDFTIISETWTGFDNQPVHGFTARWTYRGHKYALRVQKRDRARTQLATACLMAMLDRDLYPEKYNSAKVDPFDVS